MLNKGYKTYTECRKILKELKFSIFNNAFLPPSPGMGMFRYFSPYKLKHKGQTAASSLLLIPVIEPRTPTAEDRGSASCAEPTFKSHRSGPPLSSGWSVGL